MNVQETKSFILQQLTEIRRQRPRPVPSPAEREGWFARRHRARPAEGQGDLEARLLELEERLRAVELCYLAARDPGVAKSRAPAASPPAAAGATAATKKPFDFGDQPYRLTGDTSDGLITDVLQLLTSNQKSGRFSLFLPSSGGRYDLVFRDGEIVHAAAGSETGEAAFYTVLTVAHREGYYGFLEESTAGVAKSIEANTQFLIFEALRRIDEESKGAGGGAP